jgi:hypothetical protein
MKMVGAAPDDAPLTGAVVPLLRMLVLAITDREGNVTVEPGVEAALEGYMVML